MVKTKRVISQKMSEAKRRKLVVDDSKVMSGASKMEFESLNDDCINEILDWLSIEDLRKFKKTCKRSYLLANEHYKRTYGQPFASYRLSRGDLKYDGDSDNKSFASIAQKIEFDSNVKHVSEMFKKINQNVKFININTNRLIANKTQSSSMRQGNRVSTRIIEKRRQNIVPDSNETCTKDMLKNVQMIDSTTLSDSFLCNFTNLEYIRYRPKEKKNEELLGHYPMLKQFELYDPWLYESENWEKVKIFSEKFLKRHPNIKTFSLNACDTSNWLLDSGLNFDDLVLRINLKTENTDQFIENVHSLHKKQQFKTLHLIIDENVDFLLNSKLSTLKFVDSIEINSRNHENEVVNGMIGLPNLKFLIYGNTIRCNINQQHCEHLAKKLVELEEFHTTAREVLYNLKVFARYSTKLKCIHIDSHSEENPETFTTTLQMLEKERRKLKGACKLTIYMEEKYYMQMKNNSSTSSYGLIEIKRIESYPLSKHPLRPSYFTYSID